MLDQAELMQLALNASGADDSGAALGYLKEAVSRPDASGIAHYLLGAEYAQIKMYERAVGEMEAALALDPTLSIARLQLGLLWLTGGGVEQAALVFAPLDELAAGDPLRLFGRGLRHMIGEELADARACLQEGIRANLSNAPLNVDMQRIVNELERIEAGQPAGMPAGAVVPAAEPAEQPEEQAEEAAGGAHHLFLSAYTGNTAP
ncbi:hypothetical protein CR152_07280 [Massilia violaceinigra]|uniref:Uncharacterized protein n=2 Tax=Massilia violaceinigra TaxID=2045208 RepID=A0A2D2DH81_9BURK|nr:hypothetical protein CR152_07280 [Massilia violaceinigra]